MNASRRVRLTLAVWLAAGLGGALATAQGTVNYAGRPLGEVLAELRVTRGLPLLFSSELVPPDLRVQGEPDDGEPSNTEPDDGEPSNTEPTDGGGRILVQSLLAPHGLELHDAAGGVWVVVRSPNRPSTLEIPRVEDAFAETISIHSSRLSLFEEQPESTLALRREEIEGLPHLGGDLLRATSILPGVAANDVTARPSVRAGRTDELKILLDGQELYEAFHLRDYDSALSVVAERNLSSATLSTGNFATAHGDRLGGVLDLVTTEPAHDLESDLGLSVLDATASVGGRRSNGVAWLVNARLGSLELAERAIGTEEAGYWDGFGKLDVALAHGLIGGRALVAEDRLSLDETSGDDFERFANEYDTAQVWLFHSYVTDWSLDTTASWAGIRRRRGGSVREEEGEFSLSDRRRVQVYGLSQRMAVDLGERHTLDAGWEGRRFDAQLDYSSNLEPDLDIFAPFALPRLETRLFDDQLERDHLGVWASDRWLVNDRLTVELGLRHDGYREPAESVTSPRVNLAWRMASRTVLRAGWGEYAQSQRPQELGIEDGEGELERLEVSRQSVLGLEHTLAARRLGVDAFRVEAFDRRIDDPRRRAENLLEPINVFPEIEPDRVRLVPEDSLARGFEGIVKGGFGSRIEGFLAYTWSRADETWASVQAGEPRLFDVPRALDQRHALALVLGFRLPRDWRLHLAWKHHSGWPTTAVELQEVVDPEEPEEDPETMPVFARPRGERFPAYHRLDLRLARTFDLNRGELTVYLDVQNAYAQRNLAGFDVLFDEEAETLTLEPEYWPRAVPSVGVHWSF